MKKIPNNRSISGKSSESSIGYQAIQFSEEDSFIICSDGVHNTISVEHILEYGSQENGLLELEDIFLKEAQDNYSVITVGF